jgi:hypothetical protein
MLWFWNLRQRHWRDTGRLIWTQFCPDWPISIIYTDASPINYSHPSTAGKETASKSHWLTTRRGQRKLPLFKYLTKRPEWKANQWMNCSPQLLRTIRWSRIDRNEGNWFQGSDKEGIYEIRVTGTTSRTEAWVKWCC